ncbi:MAG: DNA-formamidopyrimidine glycosylase, partial [Leptolyngbya sp. SIO1D8]|nr:DNA-formamidopyrimidine glycosylase [Leptolyngbya sp. SIO1D8]
MPELPEVETVCRGLNQTSLNTMIRGGEVLLPRSIAYPDSIEAFLQGISNTTLSRWSRRGKYLIACLKTPSGEL